MSARSVLARARGAWLALAASLLAAPSSALGAARQEQSDGPRPNLVLLVVDDLGAHDLGCYGGTFAPTPRIDGLAAEGLRLTQAYSCGPNCAPSRASLLTGRYTPRHGIYTVNNSDRGKTTNRKLVPIENATVLPPESMTLAEVLADAGYVCASVGKWHLGPDPTAEGFAVNVGGYERGSPAGYFSPYRNPQLPDGEDGEYLTDRLTSEALKFIGEQREQSFFLYMSYYAVHAPIQGRKDLVQRFEASRRRLKPNADYAAMVAAVDESVGRIVDELDRLGLSERTLVMLVSDNGGHSGATTNEPLRGAKGMLYEGGIRVPWIVRWPGRVQVGENPTPAIGVDLLPTVVDALGVERPEGVVLDGESLLPLFEGGSFLPRPLFWHFPAYLEAHRDSESPWRTTPVGAIRFGDYKLLEFFEDGNIELYHLRNDPGETTDLAASEASRADALHQALVAWREAIDAPVPSEENPFYTR